MYKYEVQILLYYQANTGATPFPCIDTGKHIYVTKQTITPPPFRLDFYRNNQ